MTKPQHQLHLGRVGFALGDKDPYNVMAEQVTNRWVRVGARSLLLGVIWPLPFIVHEQLMAETGAK